MKKMFRRSLSMTLTMLILFSPILTFYGGTAVASETPTVVVPGYAHTYWSFDGATGNVATTGVPFSTRDASGTETATGNSGLLRGDTAASTTSNTAAGAVRIAGPHGVGEALHLVNTGTQANARGI
ncbi:MAG: hypothetical protein FWG93_05520, partial [Oscillospiraceae bacterium]|nr:hypothetical protein [Oscillospiraceae bacterium]